MENHRIATIINFCSNDYRFLSPCIREVMHFSSQILIPVCDHFFDGTLENLPLLQRAYGEHPECEFIEFNYNPDQPYGYPCTKRPGDLDWSRHWHSTARMIGYLFLKENIDYVLFIDVDEIYEGKKFKNWLDNFPYQDYSALRFLSYQYFRDPCHQSKEWFTLGVMAKKSNLTPEIILNVDERMGLYKELPEKKIMGITGPDALPMIHHYSWVRTKEQMLKKVIWGHYWEKNWKKLIEEEFSRPFNGKDFTTKSDYHIVSPYISCEESSSDSSLPPKEPTHKVSYQDIFRKDLLKMAFANP
ncbi:MAG: hypothetical protein V4489_09640 [Chlamydiota bacterium]